MHSIGISAIMEPDRSMRNAFREISLSKKKKEKDAINLTLYASKTQASLP
jgi:hypothetical protein